MKKPIEHLPFFVYGTLLPGHDNYRRFFTKIKPVSAQGGAELPDHILLGNKYAHFPYMADAADLPDWAKDIEHGNDMDVRGVLLFFREEDFPKIVEALDYLEGVPDHYNRKVVEVITDDRKLLRAWTYYAEKWLVDELLPYPFVPNGDWHALHPPKKVKKHVSTKPEV